MPMVTHPTETGGTVAVEIDQLEKIYSGGIHALRGINLSIEKGSIFALLGPNGAGKSTTMRTLATLTQATAGTAKVLGFDTSTESSQIRQKIGYVPQTKCSDPYASVRDNLLFQARVYRIRRGERMVRIDQLMSDFGLMDSASCMASQLSGGMRRRLEIAMGIVHKPTLLLLDEPTVGLDPDARLELWDMLTKAVDRDKMTLVFSTHYLDEVDQYASKVAIIDAGRVMAEGSPAELKRCIEGKMYTVELARRSDGDAAMEIIRQIPRVTRVLQIGGKLHITGGADHEFSQQLSQLMKSTNIEILSLQVAQASLGDVYTRVTTKAFDPSA
ncbi:ABC transporter ATP-binding protein [Verminephrobacter aporrectodeae subsp. tuberculatae]|uniref:ABC transporter ATP-binding protein n=1 Tax=Verminephrobacter aporrectodeae TaxID=1110389 RepID=UPI002237360C|nr:ABC transporter ATP-binding protein [Verminephrobacter aporrectodeae]MCW5255653.1 ABC transporter ATP-binding protein [Verminephrobacter aporrectodeae subsp. tuberculatae]